VTWRELRRGYLSRLYLKYGIWSVQTPRNFFGLLGLTYTVLEAIDFFSAHLATQIKQFVSLPAYLCSLLVLTALTRFVSTSISCRLERMDVEIGITVGSILDMHCSCVIPANTTFDTRISDNLISQSSLQGQFTSRFYESNEGHLDSDIQQALSSQPVSEDLRMKK